MGETFSLSGKIVDKIAFSSTRYSGVYLIVQDDQDAFWMCRTIDAKLMEKLKDYKEEEMVTVDGFFIDETARHIQMVEVKKESGQADSGKDSDE